MPTSCSTSFFRARPRRPHAPLLRPGMALTKEAPPEARYNLRPPPKEAAPPSPHPSVEGIEIIKTTSGQRKERCPYSEGDGRRQTRSSQLDQRRVRPGLLWRRAPGAHEGPQVCCCHCVGFMRLKATCNSQTVHMYGTLDISSHRKVVSPPSVPGRRQIACAWCKRGSTNAEAEAPRPRPTETGSQGLGHLVARSATGHPSCLANIFRKYRLFEYHTRWALSRFSQESGRFNVRLRLRLLS